MIWAKSDPRETLLEHTGELVKCLKILKNSYGNLIPNSKVWDLLEIAVWYHDAGKVYTPFQNGIRKALGLEGVKKCSLPDIPHNMLSPFFVPLSHFDLSKEEQRVLIQAIAYHHEREFFFDEHVLKRVYEEDLKKNLDSVQQHIKKEVARDESLTRIIRYMERDNRIESMKDKDSYLLYVLVKGLLHRLDHAASAHVTIELDVNHDLAEMAKNYIYKIKEEKHLKVDDPLRPLQRFALEHQNQNMIIVAQTGMGKTEAALLWAGQKKTFFTLPLRVSLNALYNRVYESMSFKGAGLLHSSSASFLQENGDEDWEVIYDQSKQLSNKLLFTTIDQILKFPVKYLGYEKHYATMAYSAVIIDEIQAYDPKIVAFLIKALEMIDAIGGKFMIMTATLPAIYLDKIKERGHIHLDRCLYEEFTDDQFIRHRIQLHDDSIIDAIDQIVENGLIKKVLVIVNTVNQARNLFKEIQKKTRNVRLLHSMFIQKHRAMLENDLLDFNKNRDESGIWITTQLVEASIDIDFDELYTEVATLDSLFQRFGRCYRQRKLDHGNINIHIYTGNPSGYGYIYDKDIVDRGIKLLKKWNEKELLESIKVNLVKELYSYENLKGTQFQDTFEKALKEIDAWPDYFYNIKEAQRLLRQIQNELVIPRELYNSTVSDLVIRLAEEEDQNKRMELRREIEKYTLSIRSSYLTKQFISPIEIMRKSRNGKTYPVLPYIKVIDYAYDFDEELRTGMGIKPDEQSSNFL
jgi:CRISPR-associated endonuclease/helicase Cas3